MKINLTAPIVPGKSIADIELSIFVDKLSEIVKLDDGNRSFAGEIYYVAKCGCLSFGVHDESKRLFRISALEGYKGSLFEKYKPGMLLEPLMSDEDWYFTEEHEGFLSTKNEGVIISADLEDPAFDELSGRKIGSISVYVKNIDNISEEWA